jgi:hypothetical protein
VSAEKIKWLIYIQLAETNAGHNFTKMQDIQFYDVLVESIQFYNVLVKTCRVPNLLDSSQ